MFEHFGLKDLFVGLWKYKLIWIIVGIISLFGISGFYYLENKEAIRIQEANPKSELLRYEASRVFMFSMNGQASDSMAVLYKDITQSTECLNYVFSKLTDEYTLDELKPGLNLEELSDESINGSLLSQYITYNTLGEQHAAELLVLTPDKEISEKMRDAVIEYYQQSVSESGIVSLSFVTDGSTRMIYKEIPETNRYSENKTNVILFFAVVWFLSFVCIFVYVLFNPTLNRRTDFAIYEVDFLGEFPSKVKQ